MAAGARTCSLPAPVAAEKPYQPVRWATKPVSRAQPRHYRLPRLLLELSQAKGRGSYARLLGQLARIELPILDDWGLEAVNAEQPTPCRRSWMIGANTRRSWSVSCTSGRVVRELGGLTPADAIWTG